MGWDGVGEGGDVQFLMALNDSSRRGLSFLLLKQLTLLVYNRYYRFNCRYSECSIFGACFMLIWLYYVFDNRFCRSSLPSDITVVVYDINFHLHKVFSD